MDVANLQYRGQGGTNYEYYRKWGFAKGKW